MRSEEPRTPLPYALELGPLGADDLRRFARASGDDNPLHTDPAVARAAGFDDVIAHGMLAMAYAGRAVTDVVPQAELRELRVRFHAVVPVGSALRCVVGEEGGERDGRRLTLEVAREDGTVACSGDALVGSRQNPGDVA
jgi:acyl dehydratase